MKNYTQEMDTAVVKEVVITTILRRGKGTDSDPMRIIIQVFTTDGEVIAEYDPCKI